MKCPVCNTILDVAKHKVAQRLGALGYFHKDVWLECPKCGWKPCFGKELGPTNPPYWYPKPLKKWKRKRILRALQRLIIGTDTCILCGSKMIVHKVWLNTFKLDVADTDIVPLNDPSRKERWFATENEGYIKLIESGILAQLKCTNQDCKYVRYFTL